MCGRKCSQIVKHSKLVATRIRQVISKCHHRFRISLKMRTRLIQRHSPPKMRWIKISSSRAMGLNRTPSMNRRISPRKCVTTFKKTRASTIRSSQKSKMQIAIYYNGTKRCKTGTFSRIRKATGIKCLQISSNLKLWMDQSSPVLVKTIKFSQDRYSRIMIVTTVKKNL